MARSRAKRPNDPSRWRARDDTDAGRSGRTTGAAIGATVVCWRSRRRRCSGNSYGRGCGRPPAFSACSSRWPCSTFCLAFPTGCTPGVLVAVRRRVHRRADLGLAGLPQDPSRGGARPGWSATTISPTIRWPPSRTAWRPGAAIGWRKRCGVGTSSGWRRWSGGSRVRLPRPGLARHDPWGLRAGVLLLLVVALVAARQDAGPRLSRAIDPGLDSGRAPPVVELWITPPAYTGVAPMFFTTGAAHFAAAERCRRDSDVRVPRGSVALVRVGGIGRAPVLAVGSARTPVRVTRRRRRRQAGLAGRDDDRSGRSHPCARRPAGACRVADPGASRRAAERRLRGDRRPRRATACCRSAIRRRMTTASPSSPRS